MHPALQAAEAQAPRLELEKLANPPGKVQIKIMHDEVYKDSRHYEGYDLRDLLARLPNLKQSNPQETLLVFTASDGYAPVMLLSNALARRGVAAMRDVNSPQGNWQTFKQGKQLMTPAPFYMVWEDGEGFDEKDYPRAYKLVSLHLENAAAYYGAAYPREEQYKSGFKLFAKRCMRCHSVNLVGGVLGPELNVPKNITEYWEQSHLKTFIVNPSSYRARSKMPAHTELTEQDIAAILAYIESMKAHKICSSAKACADLPK